MLDRPQPRIVLLLATQRGGEVSNTTDKVGESNAREGVEMWCQVHGSNVTVRRQVKSRVRVKCQVKKNKVKVSSYALGKKQVVVI